MGDISAQVGKRLGLALFGWLVSPLPYCMTLPYIVEDAIDCRPSTGPTKPYRKATEHITRRTALPPPSSIAPAPAAAFPTSAFRLPPTTFPFPFPSLLAIPAISLVDPPLAAPGSALASLRMASA